MRADCKLSGLSGNEIYCMRLKGLIPSGVVIGNSIQSMGFLGIIELGSSLVEIFAVGTAIRKLPGMGVKTQALPAQAIIRDKDTWLSGSGGFDVTSIRAGA
jgi:hypothetical protein